MRLINTQTLQLELVPDPIANGTLYAILSHTWADDEVLFQDMQDLAIARSRKGFQKIEHTCRLAREHGVQYAWIDTCCIDKSSSAELSEAINSMYSWYKNALLCYAYLADLSVSAGSAPSDGFFGCRWFRRGWTLQELIAPSQMMFFDKEWNMRGSKSDLEQELEAITGINRWILGGLVPLSSVSIAKRMSWAAKRETTRVEDMAYSLLGIFDVNMPMIYGEGTKAFARLQEEILKKTDDLSLFAWQTDESHEYSGVLAHSPKSFSQCSTIALSDDQFKFRDEISMTNKGVKINTAIQSSDHEVYVLDLHCYKEEGESVPMRIGIYLKRALDTYYRYAPQHTTVAGVLPGDLPRPRFLSSTAPLDVSFLASDDRLSRICFLFPSPTTEYQLGEVRAVPETYWYGSGEYFAIYGLEAFKGFIRFSVTSRASPPYGGPYGSSTEERTYFILMCDLVKKGHLRMSLYAESGLQNSPKPAGFLDPIKHLDKYGPLGDPLSLSVLAPGDQEDHSVSMIHRNNQHDYVVTIQQLQVPRNTPPYRIAISIHRPPLNRMINANTASVGYGYHPKPQEPPRDYYRELSAA